VRVDKLTPLNLQQFVAAQKREKKRRNVTVTHPEDPANPLKYCELLHSRANCMISYEKSIAWRRFHGTCVLVTVPFRLTTNWYKLSDPLMHIEEVISI
jgi:hypothetical protein